MRAFSRIRHVDRLPLSDVQDGQSNAGLHPGWGQTRVDQAGKDEAAADGGPSRPAAGTDRLAGGGRARKTRENA